MINRPCNYSSDLPGLIDLLIAYRAGTDVRLYPTVWRMRLLLTSRVWDSLNDIRIWENEAGQMIGFAMLWRRYPTSPYLVLEGFAHPAFLIKDLISEIIQWGTERAGKIAADQNMALPVYASGSIFSADIMPKFGFSVVPPHPEDQSIYYIRSLANPIPDPSLPAGYTIRAMSSAEELKKYQAMSGFAKVEPQHEKELIESDEYAHWVVVDPSGEFTAYCECSINRAEWEATHQRLGWIDYIETIESQQKKGLGMAILLAGLQQLKSWGADNALLITMSANTPANGLYLKAGFERLDIQAYGTYERKIIITSGSS